MKSAVGRNSIELWIYSFCVAEWNSCKKKIESIEIRANDRCSRSLLRNLLKRAGLDRRYRYLPPVNAYNTQRVYH